MITRHEIAQLPPKGRTKLFDDLSAVLFATQADCATALEVSVRTVQNWRKDDLVPVMALYALHSMAEARLSAELVQVAAGLERAAQILAQLIPAGASSSTRGSSRTTASASPGIAASGKSARA